jgi:hypothetical protein
MSDGQRASLAAQASCSGALGGAMAAPEGFLRPSELLSPTSRGAAA